MAGVNYTSEFLGFHNEGFKEEDLTASTPRLKPDSYVVIFIILQLIIVLDVTSFDRFMTIW